MSVWSASKLNVIWEKSAAATPVPKANASPCEQMVKVEFDPYYHHRAIRKSAEFVLNTTKTKTDSEKFNEYGFRVAATF
ncbi:hypothetical protein [Neisseria meningitidis]|uniref:hypothetical protein n=1 Tax=Neisseria meningitidis TaxID=487 RepID=UPI001F0CB4B0|nr:hypothetical protein [Neisseria meningitidis]